MIVGTAGHIDHGKTALVRALTGVDTDRLPDERRRGISIELGFAPLTLDDGSIASMIDVPGHERFVDTMTAGASAIDAALLVVAATDGVMPQTHEHCAILRALRVPVVAVVITKIDRVDPESLDTRIARIRGALTTYGIDDAAPALPVIATTGEGVQAVRATLGRASHVTRPRDSDDLFRFVVDRTFTMRGTGTVVTGTVWSGTVAAGEHVRVLPDGRAWRVRAVQMHGAVAQCASAGARYALALADAAPADISRGATLVTDDAWLPSARLVVRLDAIPQRAPRRVVVQLGGMRAQAGWIGSPSDPRVLRLALDRRIVARGGDRMVIRAGAGASGLVGAVVVDPHAERGELPGAETAVEQLVALTRVAGARGVSRASLPVRLGIVPRQVAGVVAAAPVVDAGDRLIGKAAISAIAARLVAIVEQRTAEQPFAQAMSTDELCALLHVSLPVLEAALREGEAGGVVRRDGKVAMAAGKLPPSAERLLARVLQWIAGAGIEGVTAAGATAAFGAGAEGVLLHAERRGNLIRLGGVRYCDASAVAGAVDRLRFEMRSGREFTPSELRGLFGVSRKYLIPLLEYCDAARVTIRRSGGRVLSDVSSR